MRWPIARVPVGDGHRGPGAGWLYMHMYMHHAYDQHQGTCIYMHIYTTIMMDIGRSASRHVQAGVRRGGQKARLIKLVRMRAYIYACCRRRAGCNCVFAEAPPPRMVSRLAIVIAL